MVSALALMLEDHLTEPFLDENENLDEDGDMYWGDAFRTMMMVILVAVHGTVVLMVLKPERLVEHALWHYRYHMADVSAEVLAADSGVAADVEMVPLHSSRRDGSIIFASGGGGGGGGGGDSAAPYSRHGRTYDRPDTR